MSPNLRAFLAMIQHTEGTARLMDPYAAVYGYAFTITDFRDHPAVLGPWRGQRLSDRQCKGVGLGPGCVSTAAGAYQIIRPTWLRLREKGVLLPDFKPASQDRAAVDLIRQQGALPFIEAGNIRQGIQLCRRTWASLPGAGYDGQPEASMDSALAWFLASGGNLSNFA